MTAVLFPVGLLLIGLVLVAAGTYANYRAYRRAQARGRHRVGQPELIEEAMR